MWQVLQNAARPLGSSRGVSGDKPMVKPGKGQDGGRRGGSRKLAVRLRTAKGRKLASTRWLQRQLNDPYIEEAKRRGYRSRAAFKLAEIDDRYHLLRPGMTKNGPAEMQAGESVTTATRTYALDMLKHELQRAARIVLLAAGSPVGVQPSG